MYKKDMEASQIFNCLVPFRNQLLLFWIILETGSYNHSILHL